MYASGKLGPGLPLKVLNKYLLLFCTAGKVPYKSVMLLPQITSHVETISNILGVLELIKLSISLEVVREAIKKYLSR